MRAGSAVRAVRYTGALVLRESIQPLGGQLSLRDLVEMMAERGQPLAHTTTMRSVQRYVPEFVKRWSNSADGCDDPGALTRRT